MTKKLQFVVCSLQYKEVLYCLQLVVWGNIQYLPQGLQSVAQRSIQYLEQRPSTSALYHIIPRPPVCSHYCYVVLYYYTIYYTTTTTTTTTTTYCTATTGSTASSTVVQHRYHARGKSPTCYQSRERGVHVLSVQFGVQHQILLLLNDEEDLLTITYSKHTFGLIYKSAHKVPNLVKHATTKKCFKTTKKGC